MFINRYNGKQKGYIIFIVILLLPILFLTGTTILSSVSDESRFADMELNKKIAFYLAESAEASAMYELSGSNYSQFTHDSNLVPLSEFNRLAITLDNLRVDEEGWYVWTWEPGDTHPSFTSNGKPEMYRYRIYPYETSQWKLEAEGYYGNAVRKIEVVGENQAAFEYALFANNELSEFVRGPDQFVDGKIHSNGNLYFRPTGSTLTISGARVTSAGKMIRWEDAWRRPDRGGTVRIEDAYGGMGIMAGHSQGASGQGNAFDSDNELWLDDEQGALPRWGGSVIDGGLGSVRVEPPPIESISEGGFYERNAGLVIDENSKGPGIKKVDDFYNPAEQTHQTVMDINMHQLKYPANGLIYAKMPIRLVRGNELKTPVTIVSNSNIYTQGDFNKKYGNRDDFVHKRITKKPAALVSSARIYHLSDGWDDKYNKPGDSMSRAEEKRSYPGDEEGVLEINSAIIDGAPTVDEINYVEKWKNEENPLYNPVDRPGGKYCWANSDDFLENWSGMKVRKKGSIVHLENGDMAELDNSDAGPGKTAWVYKTHYSPPIREYSYDEDLRLPVNQPPFFTVMSRRVNWKLVK
ncbi:MAG: hypothetical protein ACLFQV_03550 [Vulcanimicrobiota bacterium]